MVSYFSHLECASGCGAGPFDPRERHFLCPSCGLPLIARYDLQAARARFDDVVGVRTPDDVLNHIFATFCIGK